MLGAGTELAGYRIEGVLGRGGMGTVYAARQLSLDRPVALKVLAGEPAGGPAAERFRREAELQAALEHPHVVTVYEAGTAPEGLFIAMQLIRGTTLRDAIGDGMEPDTALALLAPVADALDAAHAGGLVHRDVKPRNILIDEQGRAHLADFGLVKGLGPSLTEPGHFMGTADYASPEQVRGEPLSPAADVYAFAAVLYECLAGAVVFPRPDLSAALYAHAHEPPPPVSSRRAGLPTTLDAPIARGLAKDPTARPPSACALLEAVVAALQPTVTVGVERRPVTVVCAGFAARADDPELLRAELDRHAEAATTIVERHGGTVRDTTGGTVLAVFGAERIREDDGLRAVRAARELAAAGAACGVDSGLAVLGDEVAGAAVGAAVALRHRADAGEVRFGDGVRRLVGAELDGDEPAPPPGPLVGRDRELAALRAEVAQAAGERTCRLVTVLGPAGIGKSRLVRELGPDVVGRCQPYGEGSTFRPLSDLGVPAAALMGAPEEIALRVRHVLEERAPLVAAVEDVHWAAPELLDVLEYVAAFSAGAAITLVCLSRPELLEQRPRWAAPQIGRALLTLEPLASTDALRLAEAADPERRERIVTLAEGNPLFVEQLVAMGRDDTLPPTIQAVLAARIDALDDPERALLERAAVIGRTFTAPAADQPALLSLVRRELIRPAGGDAFRFAHALIRDAAYEGIARQRRAALHRDAAAATTDDAVVGHHLEQAHALAPEPGLATRAATHLAAAADAALGRGDVPAAIDLLERAAALTPTADLLTRLGSARLDGGRFDAAGDAVVQALAAARDGDERLRAEVEQELLRVHTGQWAGGREVIDRALAADPANARAWRLRALAHWLNGHAAEADAAWRRALALASDDRDRFDLLTWSASAAAFGPMPVPEAIARCEAIRAEVAASPLSVASVERPLALLHALDGDFDQARALIAAADTALSELGTLHATVSHHAAEVEMRAGAYDRAEARLRDEYERLDAMGEHSYLATTAGLLAKVLLISGHTEEAQALCDRSRESADPTDGPTQALWRGTQARLQARRGAVADGVRLAQEAVALVARTDFLMDHGDALFALAETQRAAARDAEAAASTRQARMLYERKGARPPTEKERAR